MINISKTICNQTINPNYRNIRSMDINETEWKKVFSQICAKLTAFKSTWMIRNDDYDYLAPLVNAKYLTTLKLGRLPTSEQFRQMADSYTCLQNVEFFNSGSIDSDSIDCSENSDVAYFLEKQSLTLTSLAIWPHGHRDALKAISKCRNLKRLNLKFHGCRTDLNSFGSLYNLRYLCLEGSNIRHLGHYIETANFRHLNEIELIFAWELSDNDVSNISRTYGQQLNKWTLTGCPKITYEGIKNIIDHCKELCDLQLEFMRGLTKDDLNAIYEKLLRNGKEVDYRVLNGKYGHERHCFKISKRVQSALTRKRRIDCLQD